jgi:hypothetical protein
MTALKGLSAEDQRRVFVIDQGYGLQGDRISPSGIMVQYGLPSLRIELTNKFRGDPKSVRLIRRPPILRPYHEPR